MNIISTKTATFKPSEVVGMRVVLTTNPTTSHSASHTQSPKNVNTTSHNYDGTVILFSPLDDLICLSPTSFPTDLILLQVSKILDCQVVHARGQDHHLIKIMAEIDSAAQHQDLQKLIKVERKSD